MLSVRYRLYLFFSLSTRKADNDIRQWYENVLNIVNLPYTGIHAKKKTGKKVLANVLLCNDDSQWTVELF